MAIHFITGVPRSGKTYRSVYKIWKMYTLDLKKTNIISQWFFYYWYSFFPPARKEVFTYTYTNINQFNFDYNPQIKKLVYSELYRKLSTLHNLYLKDASDDVLIAKSKELEIYDSLFVFDECHNHLGTKTEDPIIEWWLTYHGHLHQEIHLITQQMKLINAKYKGIAEYFYQAYPSSKQVSKTNFRYSLHKCAGYYAKDAQTKIFVPFNKEVFNLYVSGKAQKRVNILARFYVLIPFGLVILYFSFSSFALMFSPDVSPVDSNNTISLSVAVQDKNESSVQDTNETVPSAPVDFETETLMIFKCVNTNCTFENINIPISFLKYYIETYPPKYFDISSHGDNFSQYTILVEKKLAELLVPKSNKKGDNNEKTHNPVKSLF
jgi:zona occludens toxin